jgi:hypothetical protein
MYKDKFILSIVDSDGHVARETGYKGTNYLYKGYRAVILPFNSEYKVRLKNKNNRSCAVRLFIDGKMVSNLGDIIVASNSRIDLERFIDTSLNSGKKFKFVSLNDSNVDDPTDEQNGIIRAEFRLAKNTDQIVLNPNNHWQNCFRQPSFYSSDGDVPVDDDYQMYFTYGDTTNTSFTPKDTVSNSTVSNSILASNASKVSDGATIEGSDSNQRFIFNYLDLEDNPVVLTLKIMGMDGKNENEIKKYCNKCGHKIDINDNFCSFCGNKL